MHTETVPTLPSKRRRARAAWLRSGVLLVGAVLVILAGSPSATVSRATTSDVIMEHQERSALDWQPLPPPQEDPEEIVEYVYVGGSQSIHWKNLTIKKCLAYGERSFGINLVWRDCAEIPANIRFVRRDYSHTSVRFYERLALWVAGGGYIRYGKREWGINLVWSSTPVFEWVIRGGSTGTRVHFGSRVSLWNTTRRDDVKYCKRRWGINLRWTSDCAA
jgi:hypothetical protein